MIPRRAARSRRLIRTLKHPLPPGSPVILRSRTRKSSETLMIRKGMLCSQRAATPAVGVASGYQNGFGPCCGIKGLPQAAVQCRGGFRVQIPAPTYALKAFDFKWAPSAPGRFNVLLFYVLSARPRYPLVPSGLRARAPAQVLFYPGGTRRENENGPPGIP